MNQNSEFLNDFPIHPSENIKHIMTANAIEISEFIKGSEIDLKEFKSFLRCEADMTISIANGLSKILNVPPDMWLEMQSDYNKQIKEELEKERHLFDKLSYEYFQDLNMVNEASEDKQRYRNLLDLFSIFHLKDIPLPDAAVCFRTASKENVDSFCASAWVRTATILASNIKTAPYENGKLETVIPKIRQLTLNEPQGIADELRNIFKEHGVAFVLLPSMPHAGVNGAVKWITTDKALLAINNYGKYADKFWFAIFHEIKHIIQKEQERTFLNFDEKDNSSNDNLEKEADSFSREALINTESYERFLNNNSFDEASIIQFADEMKIDKGIVVGRLQHDGKIAPDQFNELRTMYSVVHR